MQLKCCSEIAKAIHYLHKNFHPIAHGNLKLENILLDEYNNVFLSQIREDARKYDKNSLQAPELSTLRQNSLNSDIWSLGLILYFVFTGKSITTEEYLKIHHKTLEIAINKSHSNLLKDIFLLI